MDILNNEKLSLSDKNEQQIVINKKYNNIRTKVNKVINTFSEIYLKNISQNQIEIINRMKDLKSIWDQNNYTFLANLFASEDGLDKYEEDFLIGFSFFNVLLFVLDDERDNIKTKISKDLQQVHALNDILTSCFMNETLIDVDSEDEDQQIWNEINSITKGFIDQFDKLERIPIIMSLMMVRYSKKKLVGIYTKETFKEDLDNFFKANIKETKSNIGLDERLPKINQHRQEQALMDQIERFCNADIPFVEEIRKIKQTRKEEHVNFLSQLSDIYLDSAESFLKNLRGDSSAVKPVCWLLMYGQKISEQFMEQFKPIIDFGMQECSYLVSIVNDLALNKDYADNDMKNTLIITIQKNYRRFINKDLNKSYYEMAYKHVFETIYPLHLTKLSIVANLAEIQFDFDKWNLFNKKFMLEIFKLPYVKPEVLLKIKEQLMKNQDLKSILLSISYHYPVLLECGQTVEQIPEELLALLNNKLQSYVKSKDEQTYGVLLNDFLNNESNIISKYKEVVEINDEVSIKQALSKIIISYIENEFNKLAAITLGMLSEVFKDDSYVKVINSIINLKSNQMELTFKLFNIVDTYSKIENKDNYKPELEKMKAIWNNLIKSTVIYTLENSESTRYELLRYELDEDGKINHSPNNIYRRKQADSRGYRAIDFGSRGNRSTPLRAKPEPKSNMTMLEL
ncbi:hypothetical protein DID75_04810 [Candidatus Marinamargulisbacteria bacterium SCGC AG-410-N11]|nr:hypothetical protein DID75_04810 [Candidatus Marinamargulisbacteria bacterium SCGC AG-410-N11]